MKKFLAVVLTVVAIFATFTVAASAAETKNIVVSGYDVYGDVKVYYLDDSGNVVNKNEATQLILKNTGSFICNGVLVEAGSNGKASLLMPLPVDYVAPTTPQEPEELAEEPAEEQQPVEEQPVAEEEQPVEEPLVNEEAPTTIATDDSSEVIIDNGSCSWQWKCHCPFWTIYLPGFFKLIFPCLR